jgi:hypothetical protein
MQKLFGTVHCRDMQSFNLDAVPSWAHSWCYIFAGTAFLAILSGFAAIALGRKLGTGLVLLSLLSALVQAATAMTLFWMCRTSLNDAGTEGWVNLRRTVERLTPPSNPNPSINVQGMRVGGATR